MIEETLLRIAIALEKLVAQKEPKGVPPVVEESKKQGQPKKEKEPAPAAEPVVGTIFDTPAQAAIPAVEAPKPSQTEPALTQDDVRRAVAAHVNKKGTDSGRAILGKFVSNCTIADINSSDYPAIIKALAV